MKTPKHTRDVTQPAVDRADYLAKKTFFDSLLTIYGRKPVLEALQDRTLSIYRLHLADSNKRASILDDIVRLAQERGIEICYHDKLALSRISRNSQQDQGVAADLQLPRLQSVAQFLATATEPYRLLALDGVTNPQNLGMILRSACAGFIDGIVLPKKGCAALSPLVIKASAGTLFKAPLLMCESLPEALNLLKQQGAAVLTLSSHAATSLLEFKEPARSVYVLGNETEGVSKTVEALASEQIRIPMNNGVESLNVAVTAALIAFHRAP